MKLSLFSLCSALMIVLFVFRQVNGGKLLVIPIDGSPWLSMRPLVEKLAQIGHKVVVVTGESNMRIGESDLYTTKTYSIPYSNQDLGLLIEKFGNDHFIQSDFPGVAITMFNGMQDVYKVYDNICKVFLDNTDLIQSLKDEKFDALLTDSFFLCGMILAEHLDVPTVNYVRVMPCTLYFISAQCPSPFSYVPRIFTQYSDKMMFSQRVKNVLVRMLEPYYCGLTYLPIQQIASNFLKKEVTVEQLLSRTSIWLYRYDFVFEFPRPIMPNMQWRILIGADGAVAPGPRFFGGPGAGAGVGWARWQRGKCHPDRSPSTCTGPAVPCAVTPPAADSRPRHIL
ncbi:UDP-glucuronosyltransferase 1A6-like [Dendrobates tinctorius]|uniref:UDP-glucuronosyltransferase 1A6-like n=1 Tax=Dendrobates tinctorius TaxID=92724 RepID=UPI003CC9E8B6